MKAMLFAAGKGTRLQAKTKKCPKALIEVGGKTLLEHNLLKLKSEGFTSVIINAHHYAEQIVDFLAANNNFGLDIQISLEMDHLLETGGGLQKASWFFTGEPAFLLHNVDILSEIPLKQMMEIHLKSGAIATLAVAQRTSTRYLVFDKQGHLCGWENTVTGESIESRKGEGLKKMAFGGIQIINPEIFTDMKEKGVFSIIDVYLRLAEKKSILAYEHNPETWFDVGTPEKLLRADQYYKLRENNQ